MKPVPSVAMLLLSLWAGTAMAQDLFGIALGQPLRTQECSMRQHDYLPAESDFCYQWADGAPRPAPLPADGYVQVHVPRTDRPDFMDGAQVMVALKQGRVVSVAAYTHGSNGELGDFRALKALFGPTSPQHLSYGNGQSTTATWALADGASVYYNSGEYGAYRGLLRVQSARADQHRAGLWD
jgi:hypothetical protein